MFDGLFTILCVLAKITDDLLLRMKVPFGPSFDFKDWIPWEKQRNCVHLFSASPQAHLTLLCNVVVPPISKLFFKPHPNYTYIHRLVGCYDLGKFFWSETIGPKATQMELYELISRTMTNPVILARNQPISRWFNGGMRTFAGGLKRINQKPSICATKYQSEGPLSLELEEFDCPNELRQGLNKNHVSLHTVAPTNDR